MRRVRAVVHIHSEWSDDADWSLVRIARAFRRGGCGAVLLSEHSRELTADRWAEYRDACTAVSRRERVLLVPGIEYNDPDNLVHIPVWGTTAFVGQQPNTIDVLRATADEQGVSVLAHPGRRRAIDHVDPEWAAYLTAIEVWNRKYDGYAPNQEALATAQRLHLGQLASLDFHTARQFFPLQVIVSVSDITPHAICASLRSGRYEARAFGAPLDRIVSGSGGRLLGHAEALRRPIARALRRITG